jgi:hypothetical protein
VGSRTDDKLKEIDELRSSIERKLGEIEQRFPIAGFGRKAALALAGSGVGATALGFAFRRVRKRKPRKGAETAPASVVVNVFPKGATLVAAAGIAVIAGVRLYEALQRSRSKDAESFQPAIVRPMPESGRQSGAGP